MRPRKCYVSIGNPAEKRRGRGLHDSKLAGTGRSNAKMYHGKLDKKITAKRNIAAL